MLQYRFVVINHPLSLSLCWRCTFEMSKRREVSFSSSIYQRPSLFIVFPLAQSDSITLSGPTHCFIQAGFLQDFSQSTCFSEIWMCLPSTELDFKPHLADFCRRTKIFNSESPENSQYTNGNFMWHVKIMTTWLVHKQRKTWSLIPVKMNTSILSSYITES